MVLNLNEKIDLKEIERQTFYELMIDGITELLAGLVFIFVPILFFNPIFVAFTPLIFLFGPHIIDSIRERTTYPRLGRVELKTEVDSEDISVKRALLEFSTLLLCSIIITFIVMFIVEGEIINFQLWYKWVPLLFGLIMFGPSLFLVEKTGQQRYYLFGIFTTIIGLFFSIIVFPDEKVGLFLYFVTLGALSIIIGIIKYISFIRKYPVIDIEEE